MESVKQARDEVGLMLNEWHCASKALPKRSELPNAISPPLSCSILLWGIATLLCRFTNNICLVVVHALFMYRIYRRKPSSISQPRNNEKREITAEPQKSRLSFCSTAYHPPVARVSLRKRHHAHNSWLEVRWVALSQRRFPRRTPAVRCMG